MRRNNLWMNWPHILFTRRARSLNQLLEIIKNPQNIVSVVALGLLAFILQYFKSHLEKEFHDVKAHTKNTNEKLSEHSKRLSESSASLVMLKAELVKEIASVMSYVNKIERSIEKLEGSITVKAERLENAAEFISMIKADLEKLYGKVTILDEKSEQFSVTIDTHKKSLDVINKVLRAHNEKIRNIK